MLALPTMTADAAGFGVVAGAVGVVGVAAGIAGVGVAFDAIGGMAGVLVGAAGVLLVAPPALAGGVVVLLPVLLVVSATGGAKTGAGGLPFAAVGLLVLSMVMATPAALCFCNICGKYGLAKPRSYAK